MVKSIEGLGQIQEHTDCVFMVFKALDYPTQEFTDCIFCGMFVSEAILSTVYLVGIYSCFQVTGFDVILNLLTKLQFYEF